MSTKNDAFRKNGEKTNHIPGIYNYCDRWCERCPFTSRCLNFEMSEEKFGDLQNGDITNEIFWQKLSEILLTERVFRATVLTLDRLESLGVQCIALSIQFPVLVRSQPRAGEYLNFYKRVIREIRQRGLAVIVESFVHCSG